jgi:hypothetical protein
MFVELTNINLRSLCFVFQEDIAQTLAEHWVIYKKRSESFPRLPKPVKSHLARYNKRLIFLIE